jgi:hypothetical protein
MIQEDKWKVLVKSLSKLEKGKKNPHNCVQQPSHQTLRQKVSPYAKQFHWILSEFTSLVNKD